MALGYIGHEKNFVYINGDPLLDVTSVDSSISSNRTVINMGGVAKALQVSEGVSQATMSVDRYVISETADDPFAGGLLGFGSISTPRGEINFLG